MNNDDHHVSSNHEPQGFRRRRHRQISEADEDNDIPRRRRRIVAADNRHYPVPYEQEREFVYQEILATNEQTSHVEITNEEINSRRRRLPSEPDQVAQQLTSTNNGFAQCSHTTNENSYDSYEIPRRRRCIRSPDRSIQDNSTELIHDSHPGYITTSLGHSPQLEFPSMVLSRGVQCIGNNHCTMCTNHMQMHPYHEQRHIVQVPPPLPVIYRMSHYVIDAPTIQSTPIPSNRYVTRRENRNECRTRNRYNARSQRSERPVQMSSYIINPANHCMSRRFRRQLRRQMTSISETYNSARSSPDISKGLSPNDIGSIPIVQYKDTKECQTGEEEMCKICLIKFEDRHQVKELSKCRHVFHAICLNEWLREHNKCPYCRQTLKENEERAITPGYLEVNQNVHSIIQTNQQIS